MRPRLPALLTAPLLLAFAACSDRMPTEVAEGPVTIALDVVGGDGQSGIAGEELPTPIVVRVTTTSSNKRVSPVANVPVSFVVTEGDGRFYAGATLTDRDGYASDYWTLGGAAGPQKAEARAVIGQIATKQVYGTFAAMATPGPAQKLAFIAQASNASPGAAISPAIKVAVQDTRGNTVTTTTASITVAIATGTGTPGAVLSGTKTRTATAGVASFDDLAVDLAGLGYVLEATASGLTGATSGAFAVVSNPQLPVVVTVPAAGQVDQAGLVAVASGGSGSGSYSYASLTPTVCTVASTSGVIAAKAVGLCYLTATKAGDANYGPTTSQPAWFMVSPGLQAPVLLTVPAAAQVGQAGLVAVASGGSGTGSYSYASETPSVCTVASSTGEITAVAAGTCRLTATRAPDANYLYPVTSTAHSFDITKGTQAPVLLPVPSDAPVGTGFQAVASGGSGTGAFSYSGLTPAQCQVRPDGWVEFYHVGTCSLTATKAEDAAYLAATSEVVSITVEKGDQNPPVMWGGPEWAFLGDPDIWVVLGGGNGAGAYFMASTTPDVCTVASDGHVTTVAAGLCAIELGRYGDDDYIEARGTVEIDIRPLPEP